MSELETLSLPDSVDASSCFGLFDKISEAGMSFAPCLKLNIQTSISEEEVAKWLDDAIRN